MKIFCLFFSLSIFALTICGQSSDICPLHYEQLPLYKGIRLGMTAPEVSKSLELNFKPEKAKTYYFIVPGSESDPTKPQIKTEKIVIKRITAADLAEYEIYTRSYDLGETKSFLDLTKKTNGNLSGIASIQLVFFKNILYSFTFNHETVSKKDGKTVSFLDNIKETVADVSAQLNFPTKWQFVDAYTALKCENFTAKVLQTGINNVSFIVEDTVTRDLVRAEARKIYLEDVKKHPFKPEKNPPLKSGEPIPLKHGKT